MTTDGSEEAIDCVVNLITSVACISYDHLQSDDPTEARTSKRVMGQTTAVSRRQRDDSDRVDRCALARICGRGLDNQRTHYTVHRVKALLHSL